MGEQLTPSTKQPYADVSDSDSEWEYEYSTTETESFYVTLDLSSHSNSTLHHPSKRRLKHKTKTGIPANDRPPHPITIDNVEVTAPAPEPPSNQPISPAREQPPSPIPDDGPEHIQILDLHSDNPLISYQGAIYSCTWTEPLGTDVLLTTSPDQTSGAAPASGKESSPILAWSRLRLVAKPVKLIPHEQEKRSRKEDLLADGTRIPGTEPVSSRPTNLQELPPSPAPALGTTAQLAAARGGIPDPEPSAPVTAHEQPNPTADSQLMDTPSVNIPLPLLDPANTVPPSASPTTPLPPPPPPAHHPVLTSSPSSPTHPPTTNLPLPSPQPSPPPPLPLITLPSHASHNRTTQASFLTALITAKRARGETDTVTLHAPKPQGTGWRAQKKAKERAKKREEKKRVALVEEGEGGGEVSRRGLVEMRASTGQRGRGRTRGRARGRGARGGGTAEEISKVSHTSDRRAETLVEELAHAEGTAQSGGQRAREEPPAAVTNLDTPMAEADDVATTGAEAQMATVGNGEGPPASLQPGVADSQKHNLDGYNQMM